MPYARTSELPEAVRNALPPRAQRMFLAAFNGAHDKGLSEENSFKSAWGAVRNAGWHKPAGTGKWVKKHDPSLDPAHIDRSVSSDRTKPKRKPDDDRTPADLRFAIAKNADGTPVVDEDQRLVFGWLSVIEENGESVVDLQGHVIDEAELEAAAYDMVLNGCDAGEMHERIGIGEGLVECMVFTKAKQKALGIDLGKVGLWVGFKVDVEAFAKVKSGELSAFSLGGYAVLEDLPEAA